jgi:hypothetical protein
MVLCKPNLVLHQLIKICLDILHDNTYLCQVNFLVLLHMLRAHRPSIYALCYLRADYIYHLGNETMLVMWKELFIHLVEPAHQFYLSDKFYNLILHLWLVLHYL